MFTTEIIKAKKFFYPSDCAENSRTIKGLKIQNLRTGFVDTTAEELKITPEVILELGAKVEELIASKRNIPTDFGRVLSMYKSDLWN